MANFFDQFDPTANDGPQPGGPTRITVTPRPQYADAISSIESGGNYRAVGPATSTGDRAVGKYQVMSSNIPSWTKEVLGRELSPVEFYNNPEAQDAVFNAKFGSYVDKYGPEGAAKAWFAGEKGMNDPGRRDVLGTTVAEYGRKFAANMPKNAASNGGNFFDQFDNQPQEAPPTEQVGSRFPETQPANPQLQSGMEAQAKALTTGPSLDRFSSMAISHENELSAAQQRSTSNIVELSKNLVSADVHENDAGELLYKDPATGKLVPTDTKTQVILRDPADGRVKVYARTDDTNEGALSGVARVASQGLASGAPTARAMAPAVKAASEGQKVAQAAERLGVDVPKAVATDSMATQRLAATVRNVPLAGDPLVKGAERTVQQLGNKATEVARGYGSGSVYDAGDTARGAINQYITGTTKQRASNLYDAVDNLVDNSKTVPLSTTRGVAAEIMTRRGNAALGPDSGAVGTVMEAISRPQGLNYSGIKDLRTAVGEMLQGGILPANISQGELKQIYSALSDDLKVAVRVSGGEKAKSAFDRANTYYNLVSQRREALAKIVGKDGNAPAEQVFERILAMAGSTSRADAAKLAQARKAIGSDDWNEFVSGVVSRMGRDPAFAGPERLAAENFSPQRFSTAYGKLSDAGRSMLFNSGGNPAYAQNLKDIAAISGRFKELQKFSNPSGTGQVAMGGGLGAWFVADPLTATSTVLGARATAAMLARPATASSFARWSKTYEQLAKTPNTPKIAAFELATKNLITNLKDVGVTNVTPADFLKAIQGSVPARSEDEQK